MDDTLIKPEEVVEEDLSRAINYLSSRAAPGMEFIQDDEEKQEFKEFNEKNLLVLHYILEEVKGLIKKVEGKASIEDVADDMKAISFSISGLKSEIGTNLQSNFPDL